MNNYITNNPVTISDKIKLLIHISGDKKKVFASKLVTTNKSLTQLTHET